MAMSTLTTILADLHTMGPAWGRRKDAQIRP
jgi:hypothetical protein